MAAAAPPPAAALEQLSKTKMFGGHNLRFRHQSATLGCPMTFSLFLPASPASNLPVLYWLSGLTCTDENFIIKSGAQRAAAAHGVALVAPDTSPRGLNVEGEADSWDFGVGAGFYLNATNEKWKNWRMYDYVVKELPKVLIDNFEQLNTSCASIFGHSMGGHGALTIYLKNTDKYKSVSAFAPIANPINCPWGQKAFSNYLGTTKSEWEEYDATSLVTKCNGVSSSILIDQGDEDKFLAEQLLPGNFEDACKAAGVPLTLRMQSPQKKKKRPSACSRDTTIPSSSSRRSSTITSPTMHSSSRALDRRASCNTAVERDAESVPTCQLIVCTVVCCVRVNLLFVTSSL